MRLGIAGLLATGALIVPAPSGAGDPGRHAPAPQERCAAAWDAPRPLVAAWLLNALPASCLAHERPSELRCAGPGGLHPTDSALWRVRRATLRLINGERRRHGRSRLARSAKLREAAEGHSRHMVQRRFFSHRNPRDAEVEDRVERTGYLSMSEAWSLAENIGWGTGPRATPKRMVRAWTNSPPHRAAILDQDYRDAGVGVVRGSPRGRTGCAATYTAVFGRRRATDRSVD